MTTDNLESLTPIAPFLDMLQKRYATVNMGGCPYAIKSVTFKNENGDEVTVNLEDQPMPTVPKR